MVSKFVFFIDDDLDDQEIFSLVVREISDNITCVFANDGINALEIIKTNNSFIPDWIFIDVNMPRMNGIKCLSEIKKFKHLERVPVYIFSTSAEISVVEESKKMGATGFIKKFIDTNDLKEKLSQIILSKTYNNANLKKNP
jgi:CheY-like chemotaxis protein